MLKPLLYFRLAAIYFCHFAFLGALVPYWNLYLDYRGFDALAVGILIGTITATRIFASSIIGLVADYSGKRAEVVRLCCVLACFFMPLVLISETLWSLFLLSCLFSFFFNGVLAQFEVVTLSAIAPHHYRYGYVRLWGSLGFMTATIGIGLLLDSFGLRWLPVMLTGILVALLLSSFTMPVASNYQQAQSTKGFWRYSISNPVLPLLILCFLCQVAHGPYYTFFSLYLQENGFSTTEIGALWTLALAAEMLLFLSLPRLLPRIPLDWILLSSLLLAGLRWYIMGTQVTSASALIFAQCLHAASYAGFHLAAIEYIRKFYGERYAGQGQGLYSAVSFGAGSMIGALISGLFWDYSPLLCFLFAIGVDCVAVAVLWFWLRPYVSRLARFNQATASIGAASFSAEKKPPDVL